MMKQPMRKIAPARARGRLTRAILRPPFRDELGRKGWLAEISRAQRHVVRRLRLEIDGWPRWRHPLRVAFLSDLHTGSHSDDVARLNAIVDEAAALVPDLVLFGGDYVNMQPFGGGRVPPRTIAAALSRLEAPLGRFAILGNHDYVYGERAVADALEHHVIELGRRFGVAQITVDIHHRFVLRAACRGHPVTHAIARSINSHPDRVRQILALRFTDDNAVTEDSWCIQRWIISIWGYLRYLTLILRNDC